jgi:hypothetical protein
MAVVIRSAPGVEAAPVQLDFAEAVVEPQAGSCRHLAGAVSG